MICAGLKRSEVNMAKTKMMVTDRKKEQSIKIESSLWSVWWGSGRIFCSLYRT